MTKKKATLITSVTGGVLTIASAFAVYYVPNLSGVLATISVAVETAVASICEGLTKNV